MFFSMFFSGKLSCFKDGNFEIEHLVCAFVGQEDWIQHVQGDTTTVSVWESARYYYCRRSEETRMANFMTIF